MEIKVSLKDKKEFIRETLKDNSLKRRECVWILNYFLSHDNLLERIHFVEEAHYCPKAFIMSTTDSSGVPFRFYNGSIMTADAEKSFHILRISTEDKFYIQINFGSNHKKTIKHLSILEDNEYVPESIKNSTSLEDTKVANELISTILGNSEQLVFEEQINKALDTGDKELFMKLTEKRMNK